MVFRNRSKSPRVELWTITELGAFYAKNYSELRAHALRILKDAARAEEVVQEAFLKVLLAAPELESEDHARGYVHRAIENICIDVFRLEGRRPNLFVIDELTSEIESSWQQSGDYSDQIAAADDAAIIRRALAILSPAERAALVMWELEARSTKEIARELGIKESSVRHTVSRARRSLRRILSEMVIDENRGLSALDLLSTTYKRTSVAIKKSSKTALSIVLVMFAFLGFSSMPLKTPSPVVSIDGQGFPAKSNPQGNSFEGLNSGENQELAAPAPTTKKSSLPTGKVRSMDFRFPGLDKSGVPKGFTVADSSGSLGITYFRERPTVETNSGMSFSQIVKTLSGAANIFISQSFTVEASGLDYRPAVAFGQDGRWTPVLSRVGATEMTRMANGDYLFTAHIAVESTIESPIEIAATADGRDLAEAPSRVVTRIVLDPSKTQVLSQAIYVMERGAKA